MDALVAEFPCGVIAPIDGFQVCDEGAAVAPGPGPPLPVPVDEMRAFLVFSIQHFEESPCEANAGLAEELRTLLATLPLG